MEYNFFWVKILSDPRVENSEYVPAKKQLSSPNLGLPQAHLPKDISAIRVSSVMTDGIEYPMTTFLRCLVELAPICPLPVVS